MSKCKRKSERFRISPISRSIKDLRTAPCSVNGITIGIRSGERRESMGIRGKSVLITGAGRGIGKRLAIGFAEAGARVGLLARSQAELDLAKLEIEHAGGAALRIRADVRDFEQMCAAADRMRAVFGGVHILTAAA